MAAPFTSTGTQHGGQEMTLLSIITNLLHLGMFVVGLPYTATAQVRLDEVTGGSPYKREKSSSWPANSRNAL